MPETGPEIPEHPIRLTNAATHRKERLVPLDWREGAGVPEADRRVRMYVCGPTVYDRAHLGNARSAVVFDVLFRLLRRVYGPDRVTYVRNLTDIDDKIIARARETGRAVEKVTEETIRWYHEDMDALGCLRPTHEPRATDYLPQMIAMIGTLIERGHAYKAEGHVLFSVSSDPSYGSFSGRSVEDMIAGARVDVAPYKREPMDFVLWKPSGEGVPGWPSPWGRGRPGWHIECSAMARDLLGGAFDIHGGGLDLQFPHHENEIAQSRCAHPDEAFAKIWMHNEMLMVDGRKMSKSLGNFTTVRDLLDRGVPGEVIRLVLLGAHYGKPLDWTVGKMEEASSLVAKWEKDAFRAVSTFLDHDVLNRLSEDLNVPYALARLHELVVQDEHRAVQTVFDLLGLKVKQPFSPTIMLPEELKPEFELPANPDLPEGVEERLRNLLDSRETARAARDFRQADAIRDALARAGVVVKDTPEGTEWEPGPGFDPAKLEAIA